MNDTHELERALKAFSIGLVVQIVYVIVRVLLLQTMRPSFDVIEKVEIWSGLLIDGFWVWVWITLAQATDGEKHKLVRVAALFAGVLTLFGLRALFIRRGDPGPSSQVFYALSTLLWLSSVPVGWYALVGLWDATRRPRPSSATAGMWATLAIRAALIGVHMVPIFLWDNLGFRPWLLFTWLGWVSVPVSLVGAGLELWLVNQLRRGPAVGDGARSEHDGTLVSPSPGNDFVVGTLWLAGGLLVTFVSYAAASSGSGGGRYFVTTGAIAYGVGRIIRGFARR